MIIVGRYGSAEAMGAVGSTGSLIHLQICLMMGLGIGANVIAANFFGAKDWGRLHKTTLTAMVMAIGGGIILASILVPCSRFFLKLTNSPDTIIDMATAYVRIYLSSLPFILVYNFGSGILRAIGDTKRPMYFLTIGGVVNVLLNIFFVVVLHRQADGVAWATFISQAVSAVLVWITLRNTPETGGLRFRELVIDPKIMSSILRVGIPSGLQSSCFAVSNIIIQKAINNFGAIAVAGFAASCSLEGLTYSASFAFFQVAVSFAGQNLGAKKYKRILKGTGANMLLVSSIMIVMGIFTLICGRDLLAIYNSNPDVIEMGYQRLVIVLSPYFINGILDVLSGTLRGMRRSMIAFVLTFFFVCVFRVLWVFFFCTGKHNTISTIMLCYPISWSMAIITMGAAFLYIIRKELKKEVTAR